MQHIILKIIEVSMSENIFDFSKQKINGQNNTQKSENEHQNIDENMVNDYLNKYKGYSQEQLIDEFLKVTNESRKSGTLDSQKINEVVSKLTPFLSDSQKKGLNDLLNKLNV